MSSRYPQQDEPAVPTTSRIETLTNDDNPAGSSDTARLISPSYLPTRRIRSSRGELALPVKRRTKVRLSKLFDSPHAASFDFHPATNPVISSSSTSNVNPYARASEDGDDRDEEQYYSSYGTFDDSFPVSPTSTFRTDTSTARHSLSRIIEGEPLQQHTPSFLSAFPSFPLQPILSSAVTLRLENTGSVARDHLASERTFMAYVRTSLAIASAGVALVQLFTVTSEMPMNGTLSPTVPKVHGYIRPLGAISVILGLIVLAMGVIRYFTVQAALIKGFFPVARVAVGAVAFALSVLVTLIFAILVAGKLGSSTTTVVGS